MFDFLKKKESSNLDFSTVTKENANEFVSAGTLKYIYLISPDFGGSEGIENQVLGTPKAYEEKNAIDDELYNFLEQNKEVSNFNVNLNYKGDSIVPSEIIVTATIDGNDYNRVVKIW